MLVECWRGKVGEQIGGRMLTFSEEAVLVEHGNGVEKQKTRGVQVAQ